MSANSLPMIWADGTSALCNHLWQSTLFAGVVWLLTLLLRKYQARTRYWLWMAASVKLLIPFSLLAVLVSQLKWIIHARESQTATFLAIHQISQPFSEVTGLSAPILSMAAPLPASHFPVAPLVLLLTGVWSVGFLAVLAFWLVQWRRVSKSVRTATPLQNGREVEALRRMERIAGLQRAIKIIPSTDSMEPGVFGIFRPVLLWPEGISRHLDDAHLEAVLAHEACHVRWRDNLTSAIHMLVSAIFWFHPLVWWMEKQLVKERELACDEEVVNLCNQPQVYAESILKVCEFCIESPLTCVSGITGADLKKRVKQIMTGRIGLKLSLGKKLFLAFAIIAVIAAPLAFGVMRTGDEAQAVSESKMTFEVASVKQNRTEVSPSNPPYTNFPVTGNSPNGDHFTARNVPLFFYIQFAYKDMNAGQLQAILKQLPDWASKERFDIEAKAEGDPTKDEMRIMMRSLLADRFGLVIRFEPREVPVYALSLIKPGKTGSKLFPHSAGPPCNLPSPSSEDSKTNPWPPRCGVFMAHMTTNRIFEVGSRDATIDQLATSLSSFTTELGRPVVNQTGLSGTFDYTLQWTPAPGSPFLPPDATGPPDAQQTALPDAQVTTLLDAVSEQLGLRLTSTKATMEIPVIDHIERPSPN